MGETQHIPGVDAPPLDIDAMAADAMARIRKRINYSAAAHLRAWRKTYITPQITKDTQP